MTTELFDRIAGYYDLLHEDVDYAGECRLLERVCARFLSRPPASVLDLGCGTGSHALLLAKRGHQVTGIDASPGMLRVARAKGTGHPPDRLPEQFLVCQVRRRVSPGGACAASAVFGGTRDGLLIAFRLARYDQDQANGIAKHLVGPRASSHGGKSVVERKGCSTRSRTRGGSAA